MKPYYYQSSSYTPVLPSYHSEPGWQATDTSPDQPPWIPAWNDTSQGRADSAGLTLGPGSGFRSSCTKKKMYVHFEKTQHLLSGIYVHLKKEKSDRNEQVSHKIGIGLRSFCRSVSLAHTCSVCGGCTSGSTVCAEMATSEVVCRQWIPWKVLWDGYCRDLFLVKLN